MWKMMGLKIVLIAILLCVTACSGVAILKMGENNTVRCSGVNPMLLGSKDSKQHSPVHKPLRYELEYGNVGFEWIAGESQKVFALPAYSGLQHSASLLTSVRLQTSLTVAEGKLLAFYCDGVCFVIMGALSLEIGAGEWLAREHNELIMKHKAMLVNVLLVHQDGIVKVNDIILHSRNRIATMEISTSSEFVYTEAFESQFLIHEVGGEEEFRLKIGGDVRCLKIEYFSRMEIIVDTAGAAFYLPIAEKWSRAHLNVGNSKELLFKIPGGEKASPDFALSLYFMACDMSFTRLDVGHNVYACTDQENEISNFSLPVCQQACLPAHFGPGCEDECEADWLRCDDKCCYLCTTEHIDWAVWCSSGGGLALVTFVGFAGWYGYQRRKKRARDAEQLRQWDAFVRGEVQDSEC